MLKYPSIQGKGARGVPDIGVEGKNIHGVPDTADQGKDTTHAVPDITVQVTEPSGQIKQRRFSKPLSLALSALKTSTTTIQEKRYILKWKEFMCIAFIWETPLFQVVNFIDLIVENGGMIVYLAYFLFSVGVTMPIFTFLLFCGAYTRRGYIKLWEMVPILKGMAWSVSVFTIFLELFNVSIGGLALVYILDLFHTKIPWSNCDFKEATNSCYPMFPKVPYNKQCEFRKEDNIIHFPAYEYFLKNKIQSPALSSGYGTIQGPWVTSVCITWFIIFILLILGFERFRTIISTTAFTFGVILAIPTLYLTIFVSRKLARPSFMDYNIRNLFQTEFWIPILTHSLTRKIPGNFVVLGSRAPENLVPNLNVFCIYGMKYGCFLFLMIWVSTTVQLMQFHYKITDIKCISVSGLSLIFAIIPDMYTRSSAPHIPLFLYFFGLWFFGMLSALYTMDAFYESMVEAFPGIIDMKMYFCAILCFICCLFNITLLSNLYLSVMEIWTKFGFSYLTIILSLLCSFGIFIYSVHKYGNDYYFVFGKPLGSFWMHGLKLGLLVLLLFFGLAASTPIKLHHYSSTMIFVYCYIMMVVILAPIICVGVAVYLKNKNQGRAVKAITPSAEWGPPSSTDKQIRSRFNPKREIRIKNEVQKCRHNCLLNSQRIKEEIEALQKNRSRLTTTLGVSASSEDFPRFDY